MRPTTAIDRLLRQRHLLTHPFYTAWSRGEVSMETLREYAQQYYPFEANFPRYVAGTYAQLRDPAARRLMLENLMDEEGRHPTHPELWMDFARALGAPARPSRFSEPSLLTRRLLSTYERFTLRGSAAAGLGALYAYEAQFPRVAAEKSRGLREQYGITSPAAHEFFRVHTMADVAHSAAERRALANAASASPSASREALAGARASLGAWWRFLDQFVG
ncbi:MAG TPA: CADD family putative folate metabolism protein [Thermoplasmata archaeon]|nr:CADD family putative folate metabolism protein [Thermoplasmata archaeon]